MRITRPFASALAVISVGVLFIAAQPAKADFTFYFNQTGSNTVVVTGTGSFNTEALGTFQVIETGTSALGRVFYDNFSVGAPPVSELCNAWFSGSFSLVQGPGWFWNPASAVPGGSGLPTSGAWLELWSDGADGEGIPLGVAALGLASNYVSGAPLSNTTTWIGVTLADFGYTGTWTNPVLEGTWTLHNPETGAMTDTIRIYSVPEPPQMMLLAGAGLTFGAWRMRKFRRKPVASTATAC